MGLIGNFLAGIIHLVFVAMDVLVIMIIVKVAYQRWQFEWLGPISNVAEPVISFITSHIDTWVMKVTGKKYSEKTLLLLFVLLMSLVRIIIGGLV